MSNDIERITEIAEANGATQGFLGGEPAHVTNMTWTFTKPELLAFSQDILAKRDEEHEAIRKANIDSVAWVDAAKYELDQLKAKLAMQAEALNSVYWSDEGRIEADMPAITKSLNTTSKDVAKYKAKIERSVLETMVLRAKGCGCACGLEFDLRKELEV